MVFILVRKTFILYAYIPYDFNIAHSFFYIQNFYTTMDV